MAALTVAAHLPGHHNQSSHGRNTSGSKLEAPAGAGSAEALGEYEGTEYQTTNTTLRGGYRSGNTKREEAEVAARVTEIDKTMGVSRLKSDVQVERVIGKGAGVFGRDAWYGNVVDFKTPDLDEFERQVEQRWNKGQRPSLKGMSWREKGYVSTTADSRVTAAYGQRFKNANTDLDGEPVVMRMLVPKGTGAVRMSPISP